MNQLNNIQWLPVGIEKAWDFFSSPKNLSKITPAEMDFKILGELSEGEIYNGMKINYEVRPLFGVPVKWQTEITRVEKNKLFTDKQVKGPFQFWEHTHYFKEQDGGVLMQDIVMYELPLGFLGRIVERLLIRKKLKKIFNFRKNTLEKLYPSK